MFGAKFGYRFREVREESPGALVGRSSVARPIGLRWTTIVDLAGVGLRIRFTSSSSMARRLFVTSDFIGLTVYQPVIFPTSTGIRTSFARKSIWQYDARVQSTEVNRIYAALATILLVVAVVMYLMDSGIVDKVLRILHG